MDDDPPDRDPEPFGARPGESERSDPPRDDEPGEIDDEDEGWTSEILIALGLVGGVLLLAGLLFVGLGGLGSDGGEAAPANNTTSTTNATDAPNATHETEDPEDVQEGGVENDTEPAPTDDPATEPEPEPDPEPEPEPEPNETEPGPELNETGNETEPQPGATAVVHVVDQAGDPVEDEPVIITAMDGSESTHTTDENGVVVIELAAGSPEDVARFDVRVRDQEQTVFVQRDDVHGIQEVVFEVGESDPSGNETGTNESVVAAVL